MVDLVKHILGHKLAMDSVTIAAILATMENTITPGTQSGLQHFLWQCSMLWNTGYGHFSSLEDAGSQHLLWQHSDMVQHTLVMDKGILAATHVIYAD